MLPNIDGFTIGRQIREINTDIPMIFLTAKTLKSDVLEGYQIGADDYIKKPFDSEVLLYKIRAILNRRNLNNVEKKESDIYKIGEYSFDYKIRCLSRKDNNQKLSPKEAEVLKLLCIYKNEVLTRELALKTIWGDDNYFTTRSMDVYITKLRKYLKDDKSIEIVNIHGSGFRLIVS